MLTLLKHRLCRTFGWRQETIKKLMGIELVNVKVDTNTNRCYNILGLCDYW